MPPPLPPKPRFLTQSKAPSFSADFGISSLFPVGISSASSSAAAPNEFVGSDRHRAGAQPNQSSAFLKATTEEKEEEDVEASKVPISEQYLQHNLTNCYKVPTTTAFSVASFALSRNCENKENREPAPTADSAGKAKEQTQAEVKGESAKQRIGHQIGQGRATQPKQQQKHRPTDPSPPRVAHPPQQRMPEAAMPSAPSDGSPKQQPDSSVDLEQVLKSEVARAPFHQFLQQQFCAENINFYLAVEEYKKIPEIEFGRRTDFGRQIFDRHFAANCIEPVNIDNSTSNQIREAYKKNRFTSEVYDVVQYQIFHLLKYDCWPRYLRAGGQLAEEFGGDSKSHDSGASTSQQCLVVGTGNGKQSQPRRKSLFRFLMKSAKTSGTDIASYSGRIDDAEEADACCTCTVAEHQRQHLFGALNGCSVRAVLLRRAHSRSPSRVGLRRTRRSCTERTTASAASVAAAHAAALMLSASVATSSIGEGKDADESAASRAEATEGVQQQQQQEHRRRCTCRCRRCRKAAIDQFCEPKPDFPLRFCTLLCADSATSTEIALSDPFQSVKQWATAMAEGCGLDKHACEVVDAQTGSTIDPVRQAVDALNKRVVRIIPVVKLPVLFLAPSSPCVGAKPSSPMAAKVVILRCRPALTVGKVLRPIMAKYNVDSEQMVVCIAGTCEVLKLQTPVNAVFLKILAVMSQQQFAERKVMPKREYQKELTMVPSWMTGVNTASTLASSSASLASGQSSPGPDSLLPPFHQHGDVGFCELPLEAESTSKLGIVLLKHSATRSYSSNPREFFKFGRKPTMAKARGGLDQQQLDAVTGGAGAADNADSAAYPSGSSGASQLRYRKSGGSGMGSGRSGTAAKEAESRRKSLGAAAAANAIATGAILHRDSPLGTPTGSITGVSTSGRLSSAMAVGLVAPSDIPYCGEVEPPEEPPLEQETCSTYAVHSTLIRHEQVYGTKSAVITSTDRKGPFKSEDSSRNRSAFPSGANGSPASTASPLPAIFSSTVRSDKNGAGGGINASPSTETMVWQKADYV